MNKQDREDAIKRCDKKISIARIQHDGGVMPTDVFMAIKHTEMGNLYDTAHRQATRQAVKKRQSIRDHHMLIDAKYYTEDV